MKWLSVQIVSIFLFTVNCEDWNGNFFPSVPSSSPVESTTEPANYLKKDGNWTGPYFPHVPSADPQWNGSWFPGEPGKKKSSIETATPINNYLNKDGNWTGPYFPNQPPAEPKWNGSWFPGETPPAKVETKLEMNLNDQKWFPHSPAPSSNASNEIPVDEIIKKAGAKHPSRFDAESINLNEKAEQQKMPLIQVNETDYELEKEKLLHGNHNMGQMGVVTQCDNAMADLATDFDPEDTASKAIYTCMGQIYDPKPNIQPLITLFNAPVRYVPIHRCMSTKIIYNERIPILGPHRPLWLGFGEYEYAPPQRWLHNIEHGSIIMLYHPCANKEEVFKLKNLLTNCLYRHVITPYPKLERDRPIALAAWGATLEMSVFNKDLAKNFIMQYAKTGPEKTFDNGQYRHLLIKPALLVTDVMDSILCPNI